MANTPNGAEKRQFGRRQTLLHAWVSIPGRPRVPCIVRNISVGGALLEFPDLPPWLPYSFQLTIEATRFVTTCEIRHYGSSALGVRFIERTGTGPAKPQIINDIDRWAGLEPSQASSRPRG